MHSLLTANESADFDVGDSFCLLKELDYDLSKAS
jgi:hypothetical protein